MAKLGINTGSAPNDGTGDTLLAAALKINQNFDEIYTTFGDGTNISGSVPYTPIAGFATYASLAGVSSYSTLSGVSTYSTLSGVSSYSNRSGVSTYSTIAGVSTTSAYAVTSGLSTLSQGLTGTPNINVGIATAASLNVSSNATVAGILTVGSSSIVLNGSNSRINVGTGVTIDGSTGIISARSFFANGLNVGVITANTIIYEGSVLQTYWNLNASGLSTSSNVGIGLTLPTSKLTVSGDARFTGVVTASSFSGSGSALSGVLKNVVEDTSPELGGDIDLNNKTIFGTGGINFTGVTTSSDGYVSGTINSFDYNILYATWGPLTTENFRIRTFNNVGTNIPGVEFATSREASEIYVRQYSFGQNLFGIVENQVTLLNNQGNTIINNNIGIGNTLPTSKLSVTGDGVFTGIVTATSFKGSSQVGLSSAGVYLGFATQFNFVGTGITLTTDYNGATGIATLTFSGVSGDLALGGSYWKSTTIGIHTLSNVGVGTTNPTSKFTVVGNSLFNGITTFAGITTVTGSTLFTKQINVSGISTLGNASATTLNVAGVSNFSNYVSVAGTASFKIDTGSGVEFKNASGGALVKITADGGTTAPRVNINSAYLQGNSSGDLDVWVPSNAEFITLVNSIEKFRVSGFGVTVTGTTFTDQLSVSENVNVSGILTATQIDGTIIGSIDNAVNLTGGTANASSLNVSGIATISAGRIQVNASSNIRIGNLPAGSGSGRNIAIGDQVLASLSGGSGRNIGIGELSYYDTTTGQYNIGVGERSGQKVSTGSYNVILGAYDGNSGNLDIRTSSRNVVIADGEGNIRQYINSSGNVGIKTTVVTEALTVAGVVSATSFYGTLNAGQLTGALPAIDGSALIGVVGSGSGVIIEDDATPVGTAGTINFGSNLSVSFADGTATVTGSGLATYANVSGIATYATTAGFATASNTSTYSTSSGVSTTSGTAGYASTAGISSAVSGTININTTGIITASSFSGSASGLTNIPSGQLTGALPAIDGSALLNVTAAGTGVAIHDDQVNVGSATTIDFGPGLDVTFSAGVATVTASGGSLQSRTTVTGVTTSIADDTIGNIDISGFKSYALLKVGLSTAGWLRLYTDSASRANDISRSIGEDPAPGSGVIAEVITTGISTTQIISPFVMGGNLDNPVDTTIYAAITNLSGSTQAITANLTILQLEA